MCAWFFFVCVCKSNVDVFSLFAWWIDLLNLAIFFISHSHASFPSKLLKAIANACKAHKGYRKSIVNTSSDVRPNCITIYSGSESWTSWKFFTDACVTRPWKFKTYDWVSSFQTGVLLCNSTTLSIFCISEWPEKTKKKKYFVL